MDVKGLVTTSAPLLKNVLLIGRGGAALAAAGAVSSLTGQGLQVRGGGSPIAPPRTPAKKQATSAAATSGVVSPRAKSVFCMAIAMACHYLGYSLARPITISLFTSSSTGYAGYPAAFPFAMAFVSPMSLLLLLIYAKVLDKHGPRGALNYSTVLCAAVMSASAAAISSLEKMGFRIADISIVKFISGPLFVFRESYVQLLTSQYWSFMASALTPTQSAKWFGPIAGLTSITSAVAGFAVSPLIRSVGLARSLMGTGIMLVMSLFTANLAYSIAEANGFSPTEKKMKTSKQARKKSSHDKDVGMLEKATNLFARVPVLKALFVEILASQGLATVLNVAFVARLGIAIPDDDERAGWVGKFFSTINIITMVLQFGILPPIVQNFEPKDLWRIVPLVALAFSAFQAAQSDPSLMVVSTTLLVMKVLEYSARRMLDEMVFVPLDFESRFLGKEVIGVFGYRFGKSLMSFGLSAIAAVFGNLGIQEFSILGALVNLYWFKTAWNLSNYVPTRKEAEDAYQKRKAEAAKIK